MVRNRGDISNRSRVIDHLLRARVVGVITLIVILISGLVIGFGESIPLLAQFLALAVVGGGVLAWTLQTAGFPSLRAAIPLFYLIVFLAVPTIAQLLSVQDYTDMPGVASAVQLISLGLFAFALGLRSCNLLAAGSILTRKPLLARWPLKQADSLTSALILFAMGFSAQLWSIHFGYFGLLVVESERQTSMAGAIGIVASLVDVVYFIAAHRLITRSDNAKGWMVLLALCLLALVYGGLVSNSKWGMIKPVAYLAVALTAGRNRVPISLIGIFIAAYVLVAYPYISSLRDLTSSRSLSATDLLFESPAHFLRMEWLDGARGSAGVDQFSEGFGSLGRGLMPVFAHVANSTGKEYAFLEGETLRLGLETIVPRFLWREKPDLSIGNMIGQHFGIIHPRDTITNISPSQIGELYMNFGVLGVLIGMFLWGCLCWWIDVKLVASTSSWLASWTLFLVIWQEAAIGHGPIAFAKGVPVLFGCLALSALVAASFSRPPRWGAFSAGKDISRSITIRSNTQHTDVT